MSNNLLCEDDPDYDQKIEFSSDTANDFIKVYHDNPDNSMTVLRELHKIIIKQEPNKLPDTKDHSTVRINGYPVSGQQLGLLSMMRKESGTRIQFSEMEKLLEQLKSTNEERIRKSKQEQKFESKYKYKAHTEEDSEEVSESEEEPDLDEENSPNFELLVAKKSTFKQCTAPEYICTITAMGKKRLAMSPPDWCSALFYSENVDGVYTYTHHIDYVHCEDKIPGEVNKAVVADILTQAGKVVFYDGFTLDTDLAETLLTSLQISDNSKLEEAWVATSNLDASPQSLGEFLTAMKLVFMRSTDMSEKHWEEWSRAEQGKLKQNKPYMKRIILQSVNVPVEAEPSLVAGLLCTVTSVELWWTEMIPELWMAWAEEMARRGEESSRRLEEITLAGVDLNDVSHEALGQVVVSVPTLSLGKVNNMSTVHWSVIHEKVMVKVKDDALVLDTVNLSTDVTHVDAEVVGETLANVGTVCVGATLILRYPTGNTSTVRSKRVLSNDQWKVFSSHVVANYNNNKPTLKELNVDRLEDEERQENEEYIQTIKAYLSVKKGN